MAVSITRCMERTASAQDSHHRDVLVFIISDCHSSSYPIAWATLSGFHQRCWFVHADHLPEK